MADHTSRQSLEETIARVREASHLRFATRPGTTEHRDAIRAELKADHEFDDALRESDEGRRLVTSPAE